MLPQGIMTNEKANYCSGLTRGRPGEWETDLVYFIINGNIN
jgi:hypothetical protein